MATESNIHSRLPNGNYNFTKTLVFPYFLTKTLHFKSQTATASPVKNTRNQHATSKVVAKWQLFT